MNNTSANGQNISHAFKDFLGIKPSDTSFFIGGWVEIKDNDINTALASKLCLDATSLERAFIDFIVQKINDSSYGAGSHYELYESRRQNSIKAALALLTARQLGEEKIAYFKQESCYEEEFKDEAGYCDECGKTITSFELAYSIQYVGEELCSGCFHSAMV